MFYKSTHLFTQSNLNQLKYLEFIFHKPNIYSFE